MQLTVGYTNLAICGSFEKAPLSLLFQCKSSLYVNWLSYVAIDTYIKLCDWLWENLSVMHKDNYLV